VELTPENMPDLFVQFWNERDARSLADLFAEEADFINVVGIWWEDKEAIFKAHDYGLKVIFNNSELKAMKKKINYLTEEVAVVHSRMRLRGQTPQGEVEEPGLRFNIFSFVLKKTDGRWHCVAAHNTDIVPGKETNIIEDGKLKNVDYRG
jgi:uncharacterized protein (TIGR02246 family)